MDAEDRIETALRRQPSDERVYDEPLRVANGAPMSTVTARVHATRGMGNLRQLAALCLVLAVVVATIAVAAQGMGTRTAGPVSAPARQSFSAEQLHGGTVDRYGRVRSGGVWVQRGSDLLVTTDGGRTWSAGSIPLPPDNTLVGPTIEMVDATHAWSVVGDRTVERTSDGGRTWQSSTFDAGCSTFIGLSFLDAQSGYLSCGDGAGHTSIFRTHDGGASWVKVNGAARTAAGSIHPYVKATDAETLWAAGGGWESGQEALLGVSRDGGATWMDVPLPGMDPVVKMPSDDVAGVPILFGDEGLVFATLGHVPVSAEAYTYKPRTYRTSDGGRVWRMIDGALLPGGFGLAISPDQWLAIDGARGLAWTADAGRSWSHLPWSLPAEWAPWLGSCSVVDARETLVVMACQPENEWPKLMLFSEDGGRTWRIPDLSHAGAQPTPSGGTPSSTDEIKIGCMGQGQGFSPAMLDGEGTAERGPNPAAGPLRLALDSAELQMAMPKTGWHVVYSTADVVEFVNLVEGGPLEVTLQKGTGRQPSFEGWAPISYGSCILEAIAPSGYGPATWELDPATPLTPDSTEVAILVTEQSCAGGRTPPASAIRADVRTTDKSVTIQMSVESLQGPATCPGNPAVRTVVKLDGRLANRSVFDGGVWPPARKAAGGSPLVTPAPTAVPGTSYTVQAGDTVESIGARFHYDPDELRVANPGLDVANLKPGDTLILPTAHGPINCSPDLNDIRAAGFFKAGSMITKFDVYCPILPASWTVAADNEDQLNGRDSVDYLEISYAGPNGATLTLRQGKPCDAASVSCPSPGPEIGAAKFGDKAATLYGANDTFVIRVSEDGTVWELAAKGLTADQLKDIGSSIILVMK